MSSSLHKGITPEEFSSGYFYATEIKAFARSLGLAHTSSKRKDQLEKEILHFLKTGEVKELSGVHFRKAGKKDSEKGLTLDLPLENLSLGWESRNWIIAESKKKNPLFILRSGVWYRICRWAEKASGTGATYDDLVTEFVRLSDPKTQYEQIPSTRFNNFISDYLKNEKGVTREDAKREWENLKKIKIPKDYNSWKKHKNDTR